MGLGKNTIKPCSTILNRFHKHQYPQSLMLHQLKPLVSCLNLSELVFSGLNCLELYVMKIDQHLLWDLQLIRWQLSLGNWHCLHEHDGVGDSVGDGNSDDDGDVIDVFECVPRRQGWIQRTIPGKKIKNIPAASLGFCLRTYLKTLITMPSSSLLPSQTESLTPSLRYSCK